MAKSAMCIHRQHLSYHPHYLLNNNYQSHYSLLEDLHDLHLRLEYLVPIVHLHIHFQQSSQDRIQVRGDDELRLC